MKNLLYPFLLLSTIILWHAGLAQCNIDTTNRTTGFTPHTPAAILPGVPYSQAVQVYIPTTFSAFTVDSIHIDTILNLPSGITYVENPISGTVAGGGDGVICFSGTTNAAAGGYSLNFVGWIYINGGDSIPISDAATKFSYVLNVETQPVANFSLGSTSCVGDSVIFVDETTGDPTNWTWTIPGGSPNSSHRQGPHVLFDSAGNYPVTLVSKNSVGADTITLNVIVHPIVTGNVTTSPASGDSTANGSAIVEITSGIPPYTYLWNNNAITDTLTNALPGSYWVLVTDSAGCQYYDPTVTIGIVSGITRLPVANSAFVYPNPANNELYISWPLQSEAWAEVYDLSGQMVYRQSGVFSPASAIDIHQLNPGQYILKVTDQSTVYKQAFSFCVISQGK